MGTFCQLYIANYPIYSTKNYVEPDVMTFFRESDKRVYVRKFSERNHIDSIHQSRDTPGTETAIEYSVQIKHVRQRLNIMGFTYSHLKKDFEEEKKSQLTDLNEKIEEYEMYFYKEEFEILKVSTLDNYLEAFKEIMNSNVHPSNFCKELPHSSKLIKHLMSGDGDFWSRFPCKSWGTFFRALTEVVPDESLFTLDITDLVDSGYYDQNEAVCDLAISNLKGDYSSHSKIIILTEGSTDTEILKPSLKLLYPHLYEYYSFMDFGVRPPGGVGPLIAAVKSFAGAGIENRIIALFDNDTAAHSAVQKLIAISIPPNIALTHYPDLDLGNDYPTLGPNGLVNQNINGSAGSIELYLGEDVLKSDGSLMPIQWRGYEDKMKRYQGEIQDKDRLKKIFIEKLNQCQTNPSYLRNTDWSGINKIFTHIFDIFNSERKS